MELQFLKIKKKNDNFHARFSAKMRIYKYIIINRTSRPVLEYNKAWHIIKKLDLYDEKRCSKIDGDQRFFNF